MNKYVVGSVIAALVAAVLVIVGARALLGGGDSGDTRAANHHTADGAAAGAGEQGGVAKRPACPEGAIAGVELPCLGGKSNAAAKRVQVVNVWAWWCEPCRAELPYMQDVARSHSEWNVVGVHADSNAANGAAFLEDIGVDMPSYQDDSNTFAGTLGLPGVIPITLVVVDGQVAEKFIKPFASAEEIVAAVDGAIA